MPPTSNRQKKEYNIITKKIQLFINEKTNNKEEYFRLYNKLLNWQKIAYRASNIAATHLFLQENIKDLLYLQEDIRVKLTTREKDELGILNTSQQNSTYKLLTNKFKDQIPTSIIAKTTTNVYSYYVKEKKDYVQGNRSLRSYKNTMPVPFPSKSIYDLKYDESFKTFTFSLFKSSKFIIPFKTILGKDLSGNKECLTKILLGEFILCDSAISIKNNKIFLYLTTKIPPKENTLDYNRKVVANLSFLAPIIAKIEGQEFQIGDKDSYIYKRLAIQSSLKRRQQLMKYNSGGKGQKKKIKGIENLKEKEKKFIDYYTHTLSKQLIDFCLKNNVGNLELIDFLQNTDDTKNYPLILRNWSFGSLREKIEYKCKLNNIKFSYICNEAGCSAEI